MYSAQKEQETTAILLEVGRGGELLESWEEKCWKIITTNVNKWIDIRKKETNASHERRFIKKKIKALIFYQRYKLKFSIHLITFNQDQVRYVCNVSIIMNCKREKLT